MSDQDLEKAQDFLDTLSQEQKQTVFKGDPILKLFDFISILEIIDGKLLKFDVEKIAELCDKVDKTPCDPSGGDKGLREIFAPNATKNLTVRSHKLIKLIKEQVISLCDGGNISSLSGGGKQFIPQNSSTTHPFEDSLEFQDIEPFEPVYLRLAPDLPEGAKINIRNAPSPDAAILSTLDETGQVLALARSGDWAKVKSDSFGEGWACTCIPDRILLVEVHSRSATPIPQQESQIYNQIQQNENQNRSFGNTSADLYGSQTTLKAPHQMQQQPFAPPRTPNTSNSMSRDYHRDPTLTPLSQDMDPSRYVTLEEHNKLRYKVAQMEADIRALRLLLRSWSLDTPTQNF